MYSLYLSSFAAILLLLFFPDKIMRLVAKIKLALVKDVLDDHIKEIKKQTQAEVEEMRKQLELTEEIAYKVLAEIKQTYEQTKKDEILNYEMLEILTDAIVEKGLDEQIKESIQKIKEEDRDFVIYSQEVYDNLINEINTRNYTIYCD